MLISNIGNYLNQAAFASFQQAVTWCWRNSYARPCSIAWFDTSFRGRPKLTDNFNPKIGLWDGTMMLKQATSDDLKKIYSQVQKGFIST